MDKEYPINEAGELTVDIGTPDEAQESEKKERDKGLNLNLPNPELQLSDGSISSEIQFNAGANNDISADKEILDMDKLSLTNPTKYLATYKNPHDWILDQREAEAMQILREVAEPEQTSKVGTIAYSAGEFLRKTANIGRDFGEYAAGVDAYILPNANKEVAQRAYKNMKKLSVQTEENRAEYVTKHGVDPDVYGISTNIMEVARDIALTGGAAALARRGAARAAFGVASKRLPTSAADVARRFAEQKGRKAASRTAKSMIAGTTFLREAGDRSTEQAAQYMEATGDYDLKYYDPTLDLALNTGVSALNATIEMSLGVERAVPEMLFGKGKIGRFATDFIKGYIGERSEEFLQNTADQWADMISGYRKNIDLWEAFTQSSPAGWIGGVFSGGASASMYFLNRRRMIRILEEQGVDKNLAADFVDKYMQDGVNKTLSNMSATVELRTKNGPAYDKLKAGIKSALELQGWNEKMRDPVTGEVANIDEYVELFVNTDMVNTAIREAMSSGITIDEWLDVAQFRAVDNVLALRPLGTTQEIQDRIDTENAIIKRQTELKKTGAGDEKTLQGARMRKNILEKMKLNKLWDDEVQKASVREATTPEVQREIDTANTDAEALGKATTAAEFSGGLEGKTENGLPLTSEQTAKRLGNAVIQRIFGKDKSGFNSVMALPEYANARSAITSSADKIFDYTKKHRTYNVNKDIRDALNMMKTVNAANFIQKMQTPDFSGEDHIARNAFLYQFIFNDPATISSFIDAYLIRAEESVAGNTKTSLSKKDLVGQAFKATDDLMQTQANAAGIEYTSIYNEDGSVADKNVAAVFTSYMNQFVAETKLPKEFLQQFDLADENARLDEIYPAYEGETIEVDGKERTVYNSNGDRIAKSAEALRNFWRWFGDSKVVDEQGRPLVVYHGTNAKFDVFDPDLIGKWDYGFYGKGFYFTDHKYVAEDYAKSGAFDDGGEPVVMPVYLNLKNPFFMEYTNDNGISDEKRARLQEQGYDGVIAVESRDLRKTGYEKELKKAKSLSVEHWQLKDFEGNVVGRVIPYEYVAWKGNQIKSVDNRGTYAAENPNIYYQTGYASMRGELVGDYIDANLFGGTGEGPNVHGWGNYFLASEKIDKKRYYEKFDREGPKLKYDGKEIDAKWFEQMGITYPETRNIIEYRLQNLSITKKWVLDTLERELRSNEERFNASVDNAIARVKDSVGEEKARKIIADIEKMLPLKGGSFISLVVPLNPVAYPEVHKIQKKYFKSGKGLIKDGKLTEFTDDFVEVYGALYDAFGQEARETSFASAFARDFSELQSQKKSLEAVKKLDFDKFTGRTGFLYKGEDFYDWLEGKIRKSEARHGAWVADLHRHGMRTMVYNAVRDAFVHDTTIDEQLNKIEDKYITPWIKIKPELKAFIEKKIDEEKSRFPSADVKAVKKFFIGFLESPDLEKWPSDGIVYQDWYKDEASQADKDLIDAITGIEDHGIESPKGEKDMIIGLVNGVRDATAQKRVFDGAKNALKNVKKEDFVFKPNASMYKTDKIPENPELLDLSKRLTRQPKNIQKALRRFVRENQEIIPWLKDLYEVNFADYDMTGTSTEIFPEYAISDLFALDVDPRTHVSPKIMSIADMMKSERYKGKPEEVKRRMVGVATDATVNAMLKHPDRQITLNDIAKELDVLKGYGDVWGSDLNLTPGEKLINKDFGQLVDLLKKGLFAYDRKGSTEANTISKWMDVSRVEERGIRGDDFFERLKGWLYNHPEVIEKYYRQDASLGLNKIKPSPIEVLSKLLLKQGIRGFRYMGGTDKLGFVTFEPTPVTERLYQRRAINGFFDPQLSAILLGKNFNTMTLPHEMAHYWLETIFTMHKRVQAGEIKANPQWIADKKAMFDLLGINENQLTLTHNQQEKFATMVEAYLTGIGINKDVPQTFKEYLKWVPEKYRSLQMLAYIDDQGKLQNVFLDAKAVEFFNRWYANTSLPSLSSSPERQRFMNVTGDDDKVIKVSIKEMNDREKEFAQDAEEQVHTDERLYRTLDENMPADIKPTADAQKVVMSERGNFLKTAEAEQKQVTEEPKRRWFERKSRETEAQKAHEYIEKNPEHAMDVIYGDPELIPNDTGVDRATLINTYMAMNNITPDKPEWATLHTNIAINQSLAGTQLALSNDKSYAVYLDSLREIENALELKAATNYAGSKIGARERFNADIQAFLDRELPAIFATEPNSKEREMALRMMFEKARTTFSGNTTGPFLNQVDINYAKAQRTKTDAFVRWAMNQIKKDAGAKLNAEQQAKLLEISAKAQQAIQDIDNPNAAKAVAAAQEIRKWQLEKQKMMGVSAQKWSLFGDWAPRAMLASFNTLVVANVPSTAMNTLATRLATRGWTGGIFGENNVSEKLINDEVKRIKAIYGATSMNLAQMEKPTSPSLLHGEKYSASGQKWYDPYTILGREDNFFRVPTFVNTLARIASTDAKATGRSADEVFKEYLQLNNQSDAAKLARKQALAVANMAVFTQNGALASCLNHIRSELNKLSRVMIGLEPQGFGMGNLIAPFLTTGANIAEMGIRGSLAPITTITSMVQSWRTGRAIDPMKRLALRMDWTYFTLAAVSMALLSALTSDDDDFYAEPYRTGMKYDPNKPYDSINIDGVWLDLDFFGPFAIPIRTAAKVIQAWKKDNGIGAGLLKGYAESSKSVLGDIPLAESIINNQFNWATRKPGSFLSSYLYTQANKLVPAQIKPISRLLSRGQDWEVEGDWMGPTIQRKFKRNYGFDGEELTTQDLIELFTIKLQLDNSLNQEL